MDGPSHPSRRLASPLPITFLSSVCSCQGAYPSLFNPVVRHTARLCSWHLLYNREAHQSLGVKLRPKILYKDNQDIEDWQGTGHGEGPDSEPARSLATAKNIHLGESGSQVYATSVLPPVDHPQGGKRQTGSDLGSLNCRRDGLIRFAALVKSFWKLGEDQFGEKAFWML